MTKNKNEIPDLIGGKYPILVGGFSWQMIKATFTGIAVVLFIGAYCTRWFVALPGLFFAFVASNFWYIETLKWRQEHPKKDEQ